MNNPKYIFINEDNWPYLVNDEPTEADIQGVKAGILFIIRLSDFMEMNHDGEWEKVKVGSLNNNYPECGPFHEP